MSRRLTTLVAAMMLALVGCVPTSDWPPPAASRPVVDLHFDVMDDLRSVVGRERIVFTPDLRVCELVFRAWPNTPATARAGNALEVTSVQVDGTSLTPIVHPAGAPDGHPGTLVEVPLPSCSGPGETLSAELTFTLTLGEDTDERVGTNGDVAWFASAFPLLAWERDRGWSTDPAVRVTGDMATSETFELRSLQVTAPSEYTVMGTGAVDGTQPGPDAGTTVHRFTDPAVRDVAVTVGHLEVVHREQDGVRVHVGVPPGHDAATASRWAAQIQRSVRDVAAYLGPFPYSDLWVSVLPEQTSGIEFPGAIQFGELDLDDDGWLITHEVAHMWFYGLVGNSQSASPWLDEAFATFVQILVDADGQDLEAPQVDPRHAGQVGAPMSFWEDFRRASSAYVEGVYSAGAAALVEARRRAGPEDFDAALRSYLTVNAHQIAEPADVQEAFAHLPVVLEVLREAGALTDEP